jgi:hypothetical protein
LLNPTTRTISQRRRVEIVDIARRFGVAIVEDDPHGLLPVDGVSIVASVPSSPRGRLPKPCASASPDPAERARIHGACARGIADAGFDLPMSIADTAG